MGERRRRAKDAFDLVLAALDRLDPYGLEPGTNAPADEYEPEAAQLLSALVRGRISLDEVDGIWLHWFDETLSQAVGAPAAASFVDELNALPLRLSGTTRPGTASIGAASISPARRGPAPPRPGERVSRRR